MRRFRRKFRGLWLPVYGNSIQGNEVDFVQGSQGFIDVLSAGAGAIVWDAFPVTFDYTESPYQTQAQGLNTSLQDLVTGNTWRLRRIVGKAHLKAWAPTHSENGDYVVDAPACEVGLGFLVCKTDEEGNATTDFDETNPLVQESAEDPWIWRRKWILRNAAHIPGAGNTAVSNLPGSDQWFKDYWAAGLTWPGDTESMGSIQDGPHIDAKTRRNIGRQERLYAVLAGRLWNPTGRDVWSRINPELNLYYNIDYRLFGALSSNRGNRRNASR